jgi:hypothetical protein
MAGHRITISPGDAYGDPSIWCCECWPQWLGPIVTGLTVDEVVALVAKMQDAHDEHRAKIEAQL